MKKTILPLVFIAAVSCIYTQSKNFSDDLMQDACTFETVGRNRYFILEPGYQLTLENKSGGRLVITVFNETRKIGGVITRVVEENESENGKTTEISRNFMAYCRENGSIYYFGEEVDIHKNGKIVDHEGAWLAEGKNRAGVVMPGLPLIGARYYQEIAPGIAMDRAEVVSTNESKQTPAGTFTGCLKTEESSALESGKEFKIYAPGVGLVQEEDLLLVKYGYIKI
jgi:hypothetical protein